MMDQEKKQEARRRADRLRAEYEAKGDPIQWFDAIYREAEGDAGYIPWGHQVVRFPLSRWLERQSSAACSGQALDVGTGLGDNAVALCKAGFDVTAFDVSATAIQWAAERFYDLPIKWVAADLLDPPPEWIGAFDLVSETFTLQALKGDMRQRAFEQLAKLTAPGGRLLIVARSRLEDEPINPPPWPITGLELDGFIELGFKEVSRETFFDQKTPPLRHVLAEFQRVAPVDDF